MVWYLFEGAAGNFLCPLENMSYNAFRTVMEIDALGTFNVSKAVYDNWFKVSIAVYDNWFKVSIAVYDNWFEVSIAVYDNWFEVSIAVYDN